MINAVHPDDRLLDATLALAARLAAVSRPAMATTKAVFHQVVDLSLDQGLAVGREANRRMRGFARPPS
jgi:enoyl-CoA hydratase/carnithine racemase